MLPLSPPGLAKSLDEDKTSRRALQVGRYPSPRTHVLTVAATALAAETRQQGTTGRHLQQPVADLIRRVLRAIASIL